MKMSNNINILFRANSSSTIGTGHIMRDLVLAKEFKDAKITFATEELAGNINHKVIEENYNLEILNSNDKEELVKLIKKLQIDMVIFDSYDIDYNFERFIKEQTDVKILSLDDTYEKHHCDILLNHNINADEKRYKDLVPKECELRCGAKYTLLRDEFRVEKEIQREKIYDVFIAMGGADTANLNIKILEVLPKDFKIAIVTTKANKHLKALQEYMQDKKNISLLINSNEVAKLVNQSKLAIITPSVTVNEVHYLGVEFIAIKTADNQEEIYNYLKKNGFLVLEEFDEEELKEQIQKTVLKEFKLINFVDLSQEEKLMVLSWRNDDNIRKWMLTQDIISQDNHFNYIESLTSKKDRLYFLVKKAANSIGVIDFTSIDYDEKKAEIGLYTNPELKGVGSFLMQEIINYGFHILGVKTLISKVFHQNHKAIKLYKKFDFKEISEEKEMLTMELKNENR